jgi:adenylate cyclase
MLGELVPCGGGPPIPLPAPRLVLGRDRSCDIPLAFPRISSRHCELEFRDGFWFVRDLNSSNGTRVNGVLCTSKCLPPGSILSLSIHRFTVRYTPPAGRTPPWEADPWPAAKAAPPAPPTGRMRPPPKPVAAPALGELVPCGGGDPIPLTRPLVVIGRHATCDVVLRDGTVSAQHCQLEWRDEAWHVRDLGSRNGIRVEGMRCQETYLPSGCILTVASLRFRILYNRPGGEAPQPPPPFGQSLLEKAGLDHWQPPEDRSPDSDRDHPGGRRISLDEP